MFTISVPLKKDEYGSIQVSGTRVTLDTVIGRYLMGSTPEEIHEAFDVLPLADVYAVIGYYLTNRAEVDAYLAEGEVKADSAQKEWKSSLSKADLQARIDNAR